MHGVDDCRRDYVTSASLEVEREIKDAHQIVPHFIKFYVYDETRWGEYVL